MSRLDRHVTAVQNRLTLEILLGSVGWTLLVYAGAAVAAALVHKLFAWNPPGGWIPWAGGGAGVAVGLGAAWAIIRRPTPHMAAVAIDEKLSLKEKFSTALYARDQKDAFAQASVRDAERTADTVSLHKRFPLTIPRTLGGTALLACVTIGVLWLVPPIQWSTAGPAANKPPAADPVQAAEARKIINDALVKVEAAAKAMPADENLKAIMADLKEQLKTPPKDPPSARLTAMNKLTEAAEAMNRKLTEDKLAAMARENEKLFKMLGDAPQDKGPVGDLQRDLAKNDLAKAEQDLSKLLDNFDKMNDAEKQNTAAAMNDLAEKLNQAANNPQARQELQNKLQQAGMNKEDAGKMAEAIKQAAQGNPQAMQDLQQQVQQAAAAQQQQIQQQMQQLQQQAQAGNQQAQQQMNQLQQQQQMLQQQQAAMNQAMQQGMGRAQGQQAAAQMAQAAQQMANAMKQGNSQGAQQAGQQMQQQLAQLGQNANQAQGLQDAAQQAQNAAQDAQNQANGDQPGQQNAGQWQNPNQGNGQGAPPGVGGVQDKAWAPYALKQEKSPSQDNPDGRILASTLVKADALKGESKEQLKAVVASGQQEQPDEVEQDRVPRSSARAVKDYFGAMEKDAK